MLAEKLKESEMRYRRLFESTKDGILILDFETGDIVDANPFIVKMMDCTLNEVLGKRLWEIGLFSNMEESDLAFIELKKNSYVRFEDMPIKKRDGRIIEVEFISNVYLVNNKNVIQCNIRDITERKQTEKTLKENEQYLQQQNIDYLHLNKKFKVLNEELKESLNRNRKINAELVIANAKAEESDNLKTAFLANMSHEIRTPMNAIIGFSGLLSQDELPSEKRESFAQVIRSSCDQLLAVIDDILDSSKIELGQISISQELFSLDSLLVELHAAFEIQARNKGLKLSCNQPVNGETLHLITDENRLRQILINLLSNALKFTQVGEIEYGYKLNKDNLEFFVRDTGIGIAPENHFLIFRRFHQIDVTATRRYGGSGLGLSISKALVEKMGGKITLRSEAGKGSVFSVYLPLEIIDHSQIKPNKSIEGANLLNKSEKAILIVEDEINNFLFMEELLAEKFVKTFHAWNGQEALDMIGDNPAIKLVLMDIKMPVMDGYEAMQLIRGKNPDIPIIAVSAYALAEDKEMVLNAGFDNYVSKPIKEGELLRILDEYS